MAAARGVDWDAALGGSEGALRRLSDLALENAVVRNSPFPLPAWKRQQSGLTARRVRKRQREREVAEIHAASDEGSAGEAASSRPKLDAFPLHLPQSEVLKL